MQARVFIVFCTIILSFSHNYGTLTNLSMLSNENKRLLIYGDYHRNRRRPDGKTDIEIVTPFLQLADEQNLPTCHILIESHEQMKQIGWRKFPNLLSDLPAWSNRFRRTILENIEIRGCSLDAGNIHSEPKELKEHSNDKAYKEEYIAIFGCNVWELTYNDVFRAFDELYLKFTSLIDLLTNEQVSNQFRVNLEKARIECQKLKDHLNQPLGTKTDIRIVEFAYELAAKFCDLEYCSPGARCVNSDAESKNVERYESEIRELIISSFSPFFDLNAFHKILQLHETEDLIILFVGDNHRSRLVKMLEAINYKLVYTKTPLTEEHFAQIVEART